jgi:hypothetical protein
MRRRDFLKVIPGSVAVWPLTVRAQQAAMPVIGFLNGTSLEGMAERLVEFRQGLKENGFVEGENVAIEYRWAENQIDRLPASMQLSQTSNAIHPDALFISADPYFNTRRIQIVQHAAHGSIPATFSNREIAEVGGLMSYGASIPDAYHLLGVYTGRILKGAKPSDLPVAQASKFELVINHQTAKMLGLTVPPSLLSIADEVIE